MKTAFHRAALVRQALLLLASLVPLAAQSAPARAWSIQQLAAINNDSATAEAINNRGDVVGWSSFFDPTVNSNRVHAVLWQNIVVALGLKAVFLLLAVAGSATMWMAVFADMGASLIVVANGLRLLKAPAPARA